MQLGVEGVIATKVGAAKTWEGARTAFIGDDMLVGSYEFGDRHFRTDFSGKLVAIGRDCRRKKYGKVLSREGSKGVNGNKLFRLGSWGARWPFPFSRRPLQSELIYSFFR